MRRSPRRFEDLRSEIVDRARGYLARRGAPVAFRELSRELRRDMVAGGSPVVSRMAADAVLVAELGRGDRLRYTRGGLVEEVPERSRPVRREPESAGLEGLVEQLEGAVAELGSRVEELESRGAPAHPAGVRFPIEGGFSGEDPQSRGDQFVTWRAKYGATRYWMEWFQAYQWLGAFRSCGVAHGWFGEGAPEGEVLGHFHRVMADLTRRKLIRRRKVVRSWQYRLTRAGLARAEEFYPHVAVKRNRRRRSRQLG